MGKQGEAEGALYILPTQGLGWVISHNFFPTCVVYLGIFDLLGLFTEFLFGALILIWLTINPSFSSFMYEQMITFVYELDGAEKENLKQKGRRLTNAQRR
ncbi:hypothetical protein ACJX0J_014575, partial [Zea mays]